MRDNKLAGRVFASTAASDPRDKRQRRAERPRLVQCSNRPTHGQSNALETPANHRVPVGAREPNLEGMRHLLEASPPRRESCVVCRCIQLRQMGMKSAIELQLEARRRPAQFGDPPSRGQGDISVAHIRPTERDVGAEGIVERDAVNDRPRG